MTSLPDGEQGLLRDDLRPKISSKGEIAARFPRKGHQPSLSSGAWAFLFLAARAQEGFQRNDSG
jgi:hypothetical protein